MPIYQYKCENCGKFEKLQRITDAPLTACPKCNGAVKKLISPNVGIIFKGSGFYCTDNRADKNKSQKAGDS